MTSRISNSRMERTPRNSNSNSNGFYDPPSSSFSSTLLDAIYRSIDETRNVSPQSQRKKQEPDLDFLPELSALKKQQQRIVSGSYDIGGAKNNTMMTKSSSSYNDRDWKVRGSTAAGGSRACLVDRWMDHPSSVEEIRGGELIRSQQRRSDRRFSLGSVESISSSSDDTEPFYHHCAALPEDKKKNKKQKPLKPIRTSISVPFLDAETLRPPKQRFGSSDGGAGEKPRWTKSQHRLLQEPLRVAAEKGEGGKAATAKSRAMKFYGDLKRMKQPISPGGRLATFLNSLFSGASGGGGGGGGGSAKKQRTSTSSSSTSAGERTFVESGRWERESTSKSSSLLSTVTTPTCSTASTSSLSRSCLSSKTSTASASSSSSTTTGEKRSVRFCPVSVIIDEDLKPCGHKSLNEEFGGAELRARVVEENRRVEEAARDLLKNYHHGNNHHQKKLREIIDAVKEEEDVDDEEEEEDGMSCCSSDLFELENLMEIGRHYCEELPVYETTFVDTNRAIASGLVV